MGVVRFTVGNPREHYGFALVGDIHDSKRVLVVIEAYFIALKLGIGPLVDDTLSVMRVAIFSITSGRNRLGGVADIDHVQATAAKRTHIA